ncbi:polysaccharide biosynthesis tyrosine autokinase [Cellulomonas palmilytica]|uniref:polysaccharide biosynthesis tyrosine autokinase n=1 Tax=Cellulomonas palmilytica TaxID=2608402 RepID=UPI001F238BDB|nr:polysaccharide biosynthesis tyrosine autokinase [Cellulomonas palmilytica]UJP41007.1 polysaccharide biosynthesis tyrosine autokinase [Cellulomonas palmilytica]
MELHDYLGILRKRWLSILLITLVAAGAALGLSLATTPQYTASTQLYVSVQGGATSSDLLQGSNYSRQQVTSYTQLVKSPLVLGPAIDELGLDLSSSDLAARVSANSPLNTSLINIQVTDEDPAVAAAIADTVATEFAAVIDELETPSEGGASTVKVSTVRPASAPSAPSSPNTKLNVALGLLVGLALGIGVAVLRAVLDTRIRTAQDVAQVTDAAVIATIGFDDDADAHPLIVHSSPQSERAEALRRLRTNLQFLDLADRPRSIVLTSSVPGEGKSTTAINLAITLADAGGRVALVDADLRRPSVARYMGLEGSAGLTTVLIGQAELADVVQPWGEGGLDVLTSGVIPPNPSEMLGSAAMGRLLDRLTAEYDHVIIDAPPLLPVTDAAILAKLSGGALVIAGAQKIHRDQLRESMGALETVGARVLGVVVNGQKRAVGDAYTYYHYRPHETPKVANLPALAAVEDTSDARPAKHSA